jgi:2-keto-4-pentenoate hydratase
MPEPWLVAADRLYSVAQTRIPSVPIRDLVRNDDVATAYRIQSHNLEREYASGRTRIGRKVGLTAAAVQRQLGVDRPDFGVLLDHMRVPAESTVSQELGLLQPRVEAEVAFVLAADLDGSLDCVADLDQGAIAGVAAALEIVDSRIRGWDISLADTIADNASSGAFVLSGRLLPLDAVDVANVDMTLWRNGDVVSTGHGSACMGSPIEALLWLARTAAELGDPLRAGEIVLSGALGPVVDASPGDRFEAEITTLGRVAVSF